MSISFNPMQTLSGHDSFELQSQGYMQGAIMDDPVARMWLLTGLVSHSATTPLWGGLPITENVPALDSHTMGTINPTLALATANTNVTGFTVFNRAHNMLIVPGTTVPLASADMNIAFFRLGSNMRIPVPISTALATAVEGGSIDQQVTWNYTTNELDTYSSGTALPVKILKVNSNSMTVNYNGTTGAATWNFGAYCALIQI